MIGTGVRPPSGGLTILLWFAVAGCGNGGPEGGDPFGGITFATQASGATMQPEDSDGDDGSDPAGEDDEGSSGDDGPVGDAGDDGGSDGGSDETGTPDAGGPFGACAEPPPAGAPTPPSPPSYSGGECPTLTSGYVTGFQSGGRSREFAFAVPTDYDATKSYPLVFGWHPLGGDAMGFLDEFGLEVVDATQTIYAIPQASGDFQFEWPSTPFDNGSADVDLRFFDDLLACISEQYNINHNCVGSAGVSAGGLWTSFLGQKRGEYLSANVVISGGHPHDTGWWGWSSSPHKFVSLVLWGGPSDELVISFHQASQNLVGEYRDDGHFVIECEHTGGHGSPPPENPGDPPPYDVLIDFFLSHPYWLGDGESPYHATGLPDEFPSYCSL
jgi:predicted esterase